VRAFDTAGQAVSLGVRMRLVRDDGAYTVRRGSLLTTAPGGDGVTQLEGQTTAGGGVGVVLTPCSSSTGSVADSFSLRADDEGRLDLAYAGVGLCVLELERLNS
jgi:hypothetical protein